MTQNSHNLLYRIFNNNLIQAFGKWFFSRSVTDQIILITLIFIFGAHILPFTKIYFGWVLLYLITMTLISKSGVIALLLCFIPIGMFHIGQTYYFNLISPEQLLTNLYPEGRSLIFKLTPASLLGLPIVLSYIFSVLSQRKKHPISIIDVLLTLVIALQLFSAVFSEFFPNLSVIFVLGQGESIVFGLLLVRTIQVLVHSKRQLFLQSFLGVLLCLVIAESALVLGQQIKSGPIGFLTEQRDSLSFFGAGPDEINILSRPVGWRTHANDLAYSTFQMLLLIWIIRNHLHIKPRSIKLYKLAWIGALYILLATQSRAVYLASLVACGLYFWLGKVSIRPLITRIRLIAQKHKYVFVVLLALLISMILPRAISSLYSFDGASGWEVRFKLAEEAISLIEKNLWWGVGSGAFIPAAFQSNQTDIILYFPESVHNGILLFLSENGVLSTAVVGIFIIVMLIKSKKMDEDMFHIVGSIYLLQLLLVMFHPFSDILPFSILGLLLLVQTYEKTSHKKHY